MKKRFLLWMGMMLLLIFGQTSCNNDDNLSAEEATIKEYKAKLIGSWHLVRLMDGWGNATDYTPGEVTFSFAKDGELIIVNTREDQYPFRSQTASYSLITIDFSIYTHEPKTALSLSMYSSLPYIMDFNGDLLYLSPNAFDCEGYTLQRTTAVSSNE